MGSEGEQILAWCQVLTEQNRHGCQSTEARAWHTAHWDESVYRTGHATGSDSAHGRARHPAPAFPKPNARVAFTPTARPHDDFIAVL